jgi:hypothetical protein
MDLFGNVLNKARNITKNNPAYTSMWIVLKKAKLILNSSETLNLDLEER